MTRGQVRVVGLDIGGANLKASDGEQRSVSRRFAMWEHVHELSVVLGDLLAEFEPVSDVALTMTAELADCFPTKAEGVSQILSAVEAVTKARICVWQTSGEFVPAEVAREFPLLTAAANWHALATWAGRMAPQGPSLLVDVGSTTTDIVPLKDGFPFSTGLTDIERLQSGELVYAGVRRTPICSLVQTVPLRGGVCPIAAELFATMDDVSLILGDVAEDTQRCDTADGRPATRKAALNRLAHMLCCDSNELSQPELIAIAEHVRRAQRDAIGRSLSQVIDQMTSAPAIVLVSGEGEFLAREVVTRTLGEGVCQILSLRTSLGNQHSQAACAFALARLGRERLS